MDAAITPVFDLARSDGWFHLNIGLWDVPRGPLGVLLYLPFVPLFWITPARATRAFLIATSLFVWYATLGPAFVMFTVALLAYYFLATKMLTKGGRIVRRNARVDSWKAVPAPNAMIALAAVVMHLPFIALLIRPMPWFLPSLGDSILVRTNYLHWCGLAYMHLKAVHVVIDRLQGRLERLNIDDYLAYMLFAPTFKMGPLYRYELFISQIADAQRNVQIRQGLIRIGIGLLRLGVMVFFIERQISRHFFTDPQTLHYHKVLVSFIFVPMELYFWLAGYCDIAIGIGRLMGFRVPEQFRGPWFVNNISDFWKRWSITLGQWLFDYPFRAMVASRFARWLCFVLTFLYCGLWHGLFASYVIWGLMQGFGFAIHHAWHRWWLRQKKKNGPVVQWLRRAHICDGRAGWALSWLLLVTYQLLTISIASDLEYAGSRFLPVLLGLRGHR